VSADDVAPAGGCENDAAPVGIGRLPHRLIVAGSKQADNSPL
jgi:hypothetical protein